MFIINKKILISLMLLSFGGGVQAGFFDTKCSNPNGTLRVVEPEDVSAWTGIGLSAPTKVLRVFVNNSKCFTIVDRGAAFNAAQLERNLANSGILQGGQNIGNGQMKAADFVLVPDLISQNLDAGGSNLNASGSKAGLWGAASAKGSRATRKKSAEVVLTLIDVRTSEQLSSVTAKAMIKDSMNVVQLSGNVPTAMVNGQVGFSNYSNTPIGQAIVNAYEEAYDLLMKDIKKKQINLRKYNAPQAIEANPQQQYVNQQLVMSQQQVNYPQASTQQSLYQSQDNNNLVVNQPVQYLQPIEATNAQVQNVYINQNDGSDRQDIFTNQGMMNEVEKSQQQVQKLQYQSQSQNIHPVALIQNSISAIAQNTIQQKPVEKINTSIANNSQNVATGLIQSNNTVYNRGDAVIDFLTKFKTVDEAGMQDLINGLSSLSPSVINTLKKHKVGMGLSNLAALRDQGFLKMLSQLPNANSTTRSGLIKALGALSDNQINNLIGTYRFMLDNN